RVPEKAVKSRLSDHTFAHKFVAFQGGSNLEGHMVFVFGGQAMGPHHLTDTPEANRLGTIVIQGDDVLDGTSEIGFGRGLEEDPGGTDVRGEAREHDSLGAGSGDREWKLKLKPPRSALFHEKAIRC